MDEDILTEQFGLVVPMVVAPTADIVSGSPAKSKLAAKFETLANQVAGLMAHFGATTWTLVKESKFTVPKQKILDFACEAEREGDQELFDKGQVYRDGINATKNFLKYHRVYSTSHNKTNKMLELHPYLRDLREFLSKHTDVSPASSLELLWIKIGFHSEVREKAALHPALEKAIDLSFVSVVQNMVDSSSAAEGNGPRCSGDVVLKAMLSEALGWILSKPPAETQVTEVAKSLAPDLRNTHSLMVGSRAAGLVELCKTCVEQFKALVITFEVSVGKVPPQMLELDESLKILSKSKSHFMQKSVLETPLGKAAMAAAQLTAQRSSQDDAADEKLASASGILKDQRLPRLEQGVSGSQLIETCFGLLYVRNHNWASGQRVTYRTWAGWYPIWKSSVRGE